MSNSTETRERDEQRVLHESITAQQLPKWAWLATLVLSMAIAAGVLSLFEAMGVGTVLIAGVLLFFILHTAVSAAVEGPRPAKNRLARVVMTSFFLLALLPLGSLVYEVLVRGVPGLNATFFTADQSQMFDMEAPIGARHAILGTLQTAGIAFLISVPIGVFTSIYLVEYGARKRLAAGVRFFVDVMTGIPSIVAGLFAYALFEVLMGPGTKIALSGAVALSVLMIPTIVRSTEEMLRLVPNELREASYALGVPKWRTILKVVLPTALAGIITGIVLGIARIIGETAPLLVTAGYFIGVNTNALQGETATLPVFVYQTIRATGPRQEQLAALGWTGALVLIMSVMLLNLAGRLITWAFAPKVIR